VKGMKKTRIAALSALVGVALFASASYAQLKIGYINSDKILREYKEAQDVQKQLDAKNQEWQRQAQQMQQEIQKKQQELDSQSLLLSEEKKAEKQAEIQDLFNKLQQFQMEKWGQNGEAFRLQQQLLKPVLDKINQVLQKIGKEEKFDYIFDSVAGNIVYASPKQPDLTDRVLEELNKGLAATSKKKK